jgi:hypothetical protein
MARHARTLPCFKQQELAQGPCDVTCTKCAESLGVTLYPVSLTQGPCHSLLEITVMEQSHNESHDCVMWGVT